MKYLLLLLPVVVVFSILGSEADSECSESITLSSHTNHDESAQRVLFFLFGERPSDDIQRAFTRRLQDSVKHDLSVRQMVKTIESSSSDDSTGEDPMVEIKKMLLAAIHEAVEEKHLAAADAQMQLLERERQLRVQKYRMWAATGTAVTSICGVITTLFAYNLT